MTDYRTTAAGRLVKAIQDAEKALDAINQDYPEAVLEAIENLNQSAIRATAAWLRHLDGIRRAGE